MDEEITYENHLTNPNDLGISRSQTRAGFIAMALAGSHTFILYAVKKEDYLRVKGELENGLPIVV